MSEHCDLVLVLQDTFPTFVIEEHDVVGFFLDVIHHCLRAPFPESLDDLGRLRTSTARCCACEGPIGASTLAGNRPRLAVSDEDTGLFLRIGRFRSFLRQ